MVLLNQMDKQLYFDLCDKLDLLEKQYNLCDFKNGQCRHYRDKQSQCKSCCLVYCAELINTGCKSKNLMCKLSYCDIINSEAFKEFKEQVDEVKQIAILNGLFDNRTSVMSFDNAFSLLEKYN